MISSPIPRWSPRRTKTYLLSAVAALALIAGYVAFLEYEEARMERYYAGLRETSPTLYLAKLAQLHGFDTYLTELAALRHYDKPQRRVPPFLLGRWALFENEKQVGDSYFPDACLDGAEIEDGLVRLFGAYEGSYPVKFRMVGDKTEAIMANGDVILITALAYGAHIHHIEIALPGETAPLFGYVCK